MNPTDHAETLELELGKARHDTEEWRECSRGWRGRANMAEEQLTLCRRALAQIAVRQGDPVKVADSALILISSVDCRPEGSVSSGRERTDLERAALAEAERRGIRRAAWLVRQMAAELVKGDADSRQAVTLLQLAPKIEALA